MLQIVDGNHSTRLFDVEGVLVHSTLAQSILLIRLSNLEDILQSIQRDLNDLVICALQQIAQRLDASLADEIPDLTRLLESTRCRIRHGPARLLLGLEISILKDVNEERDNVGVDDGLDLLRTTGGDVGDSPACFLSNPFFR